MNNALRCSTHQFRLCGLECNRGSILVAGQQCFFAGNVSNFAAVDSSTVNIRVGSDVYRLDLMSSCRNVNWNNRLTLASRTGSSICTGTGLGTTLISRGVTGQQRCQVHRITLLTAAEVEALRPRDRP